MILDEIFDFIQLEIECVDAQINQNNSSEEYLLSFNFLLGKKAGLEKVRKRIQQYGALM